VISVGGVVSPAVTILANPAVAVQIGVGTVVKHLGVSGFQFHDIAGGHAVGSLLQAFTQTIVGVGDRSAGLHRGVRRYQLSQTTQDVAQAFIHHSKPSGSA
jgi:hypothetical protein